MTLVTSVIYIYIYILVHYTDRCWWRRKAGESNQHEI